MIGLPSSSNIQEKLSSKKPVVTKKAKSNVKPTSVHADQAAVIKDLMAKYSRGGVIPAHAGQ